MLAVTLAGAALLLNSWLGAQILTPPYRRKPASDKGPRALGLVQISAKGKARLIPIAIMMDGKFYDAGSYKASPVPMALDFGIVYEGFRTGVSQGIFTISQPGQLNHVWMAEGTWTPAGERVAEKHKKFSAPVIVEDDAGPPVLHRHAGSGSDSDSDSSKDKGNKDRTPTSASTPASPAPGASPSASPTASAPTAPTKSSAPPETAKTSSSDSSSASDEPIEDPNRPRLRRGKPDPSAHHEAFTTFDTLIPGTGSSLASPTGKADATATKAGASAPQIIVIPAISDIGGADPRPYAYDVKPAEEAIYRKKMLDLATTQLGAHPSGTTPVTAAPNQGSAKKSAGKSGGAPKAAFDFDEVNLHIFDLSNSNEPVLVLSAKIHPRAVSATGSVEEPKEITVIASTNLEGEMRKLFFSQTDSRHLDAAPRMELIDAVDADGDGRGELLFRRTFDGGTAYAIYRVTADGLWPLFEGTP